MKCLVSFIILSFSMLFSAPKYGCVEDNRPIGNYITADAYRELADFCFEEKYNAYWDKPTPKSFFRKQEKTILQEIKAGDIVYVREHLISYFFKEIHSKISVPYILISAKHDMVVGKEYKKYLNDPKLIRWFATNIHMEHPKLTIIPIGIMVRICFNLRCNNEFLVQEMQQNNTIEKNNKIYLNISTWTNLKERSFVWKTFKDRENVTSYPGNKSMQDYLYDLKSHVFCISPSGNGIQCWRTWESMLMGCIPIIRPSLHDKNSSYAIGHDSLYEDLPVIIVKEWSEVTPEFLEVKYKEISQKEYNLEKLYFPYWKNLILETVRSFKEEYNGDL